VGEGYWLGVKSVPQKLPPQKWWHIITKITTRDALVAL